MISKRLKSTAVDIEFLAFTLRHKQILPWDDDIDLAMDIADVQKLNNTIMEQVKHSY